VEWLNTNNIRKTIVELYVAAKEKWVQGLTDLVASRPYPFISWEIDLWTSKTSGDKYVGK
jgi:hypothetical protein